ncbi:MAG: D-alanine--D-alanine ligase [Pseudomonadota bacterium]|nr:D-alanine--D-alanine ligase [Pseudomonadota bacterium]
MNSKESDKIAILKGGISDEQEISKLTADQVFATLSKKYTTKIINVDEDCIKLISDLKKFQPDKVFNCLHGFFGEDGQVQSILNYLKIPYTHSGVLASSLAMNKITSKLVYESIGVRCPKTIHLGNKKKIEKFPVIIKPTCGGSSNGLRKIKNIHEFENVQKKSDTRSLMIEEFIEGREITVGVLDNKICGIMEIIFDSDVYDFENKYINIATHLINPKLPKKIKKKLEDYSLRAHKTLQCNCLSRLDFKYSEKLNEIFLLEINTQPGLTKDSLLPEMAKKKGISFFKLCEIILNNALCEIT